MKRWLIIPFLLCAASVHAQCTAPTITATVKGPDQINLTWAAAATPCYGYLVEIMSAGDSRYSSFTQMQPIPTASGYTHSSGNACTADDPSGTWVYNPSNISNHLYGLPPWVTEANYIDPQDASAAQYIQFSLIPNTSYSFRVRTYTPSSFSSYSNTATATTSNYTKRYVNGATGNDSNGGTNSTSDAWLTITHGVQTVTAGQVLLVEGGNYASDQIYSSHNGTNATAKIVIMADPTSSPVTITSGSGGYTTILLQNSFNVIDGIKITADLQGDYSVQVNSASFSVLANMEVAPDSTTLPNGHWDVSVYRSPSMLIYGNYFHDAGIPCAAQNPNGDDGFIFSNVSSSAMVVWSNHFTRGGHDTGLCKGEDSSHKCTTSRWLDNVFDGGYGFAWEDVFNADNNLVEGNVGLGSGQLEVGSYKPGIEISGANTTMRRNLIIASAAMAQEISNLNAINIPNFLVYNNVWYNSTSTGATCFWINSAVTSASGVVANNICQSTNNPTGTLAYSYTADTTDTITANDFVYINAGVASPSTANFRWNINTGGSCSAANCTIAQMDSLLNPPWSGNASLAVVPLFTNAGLYDFHLSLSSPLLNVGVAVTDSTWGSFAGSQNLGPFVNAQGSVPVVPFAPTKLVILGNF